MPQTSCEYNKTEAMSAFLELPPKDYYVPSTMGGLTGQTKEACLAACKVFPNCIGVTTSESGVCNFMQLSDLGKGQRDGSGSEALTSYLNCSNLCNTSLLTCPEQKFLGVGLYIWLAVVTLALAAALLYASSMSTSLNDSKATSSLLSKLGL